MESITYKSRISETFENVRKLSFEEKKESSFDEIKVNKLLDEILEFKKVFTDKTNKINSIVETIEEITWFNNVDNDIMMSINDLISSIRDLHSSLLRQYISLAFIRSKSIANEEIKKFKASIDDLRDVAADLESRFFSCQISSTFKKLLKNFH
ncbi:MAG: hypothetical protein QM530_01285 [Phycisphaerales bacterium]|nr:hypothetical protein [Phycisphaerales bacterium]